MKIKIDIEELADEVLKMFDDLDEQSKVEYRKQLIEKWEKADYKKVKEGLLAVAAVGLLTMANVEDDL